ncbi:MAG: pyridoxal 5'-phosphate synthase glutaminase subunit PdxT [Calditrichaeota bacterium]|nr:MAG: pyridoxal 5'-phosphate synthase glutaminase subunit PdxT [Calditrichota bacterium]MBL1207386.1 pyridoxal 5'-phosphate synthase glutaminase subunit PdxT [Calditrichota bacterium]NOG47218.1 pyridoxal 5'-phosphate synthase glutaminase subunit PdxT [Calditrichota bacterium]
MAVIGVLALQGDFEKHAIIVQKLGFEARLVKDAKSLKQCERLIIPGGESTTFLKLIDRLNLRDELKTFGKTKPVFGTCAGLIILADKVENDSFDTLGLIDISVSRNAYGRQIDSFCDTVKLGFDKDNTFEAFFIRAPKILECHGSVKPLAYHNDDIVMAANGNILVASFHPELTDDLRIHDFFLNHFS